MRDCYMFNSHDMLIFDYGTSYILGDYIITLVFNILRSCTWYRVPKLQSINFTLLLSILWCAESFRNPIEKQLIVSTASWRRYLFQYLYTSIYYIYTSVFGNSIDTTNIARVIYMSLSLSLSVFKKTFVYTIYIIYILYVCVCIYIFNM